MSAILSVVSAAVSHYGFGDAQPLIWEVPSAFTLLVAFASWLYNRGQEREGDIMKGLLRDKDEEHDILARHVVLSASGNPYVVKAEEHLAKGDEGQATRNYERALRANEDDMDALLGMAALSYARCMVARVRGHADAYHAHLDRALTHLEHAYRLEPHNHFVLEGLACALDEKEVTSLRAIALLEELVAIKPDHRTAHSNLGVSYMRAGRPDDAKREFVYQIDHANEFMGIYNLGEYYVGTGQMYHASICLGHTIAASRRYVLPTKAWSGTFAIHNVAVQQYLRCLMYLGLIGAALIALDEAVQVWNHYDHPIPEWVPRHRRGLKTLRRLYRLKHASFVVRRALHRPTDQGWSNQLMSEERLKPLLDNSYHYEVVKLCRLAIFLEPLAALPHANQASLLFAYGNVEDARTEAKLALALGCRNKDDVAVQGSQHVLEQPDEQAGELTLTEHDELIQQIAMAAEEIRTVEGPPDPRTLWHTDALEPEADQASAP